MGEHSGSKYLRTIHPADGAGEPIRVDVYSVLVAFGVTCPGRQHAIKKLLCAGLRGKNSEAKDVSESIDAVRRAVQLLEQAGEKIQSGTPVKSGIECVTITDKSGVIAMNGGGTSVETPRHDGERSRIFRTQAASCVRARSLSLPHFRPKLSRDSVGRSVGSCGAGRNP